MAKCISTNVVQIDPPCPPCRPFCIITLDCSLLVDMKDYAIGGQSFLSLTIEIQEFQLKSKFTLIPLTLNESFADVWSM